MARTPRAIVKFCKAWIGQAVELTREVVTRGGHRFPVGTTMRVTGTWRGRYHMHQIDRVTGQILLNDQQCLLGAVRNVEAFTWRALEGVPDEAPEADE